jgi:hypothetical protein
VLEKLFDHARDEEDEKKEMALLRNEILFIPR